MSGPKPYPSDLTNEQWRILEPLIPPEKRGGRQRTVDMREILNASLYMIRTGCPWRRLLHDFGEGKNVVTLAVDSGLKYLSTELYRA